VVVSGAEVVVSGAGVVSPPHATKQAANISAKAKAIIFLICFILSFSFLSFLKFCPSVVIDASKMRMVLSFLKNQKTQLQTAGKPPFGFCVFI
jgi:hypothetical protein